jgi:hypothetical protein
VGKQEEKGRRNHHRRRRRRRRRHHHHHHLKEPEFKKVTLQQTCGKARRKKDNLQNPRNEILILGDSHVTGMAAKLQHNLDDEYSIQGLVTRGADLAAILASGVNDIEDFSKKDLVIVWGGILRMLVGMRLIKD